MISLREVTVSWLRACVVLGVVGTATACSTPESEAERQIGLQPGAPLEIVARPELRLGVLEGDTLQEFDRVVTPFLTPGRRLVVPLAGHKVLRVFDLQGNHLMTLGGEGEGPGEMMSLSGSWARGDTIEVFDSRLRRVTSFLPDSAPRVIRLGSEGIAQSVLPQAASNGWVMYGVEAVEPNGRDLMSAHLFGFDGAHVRDLQEIRGMRRYAGRLWTGPVPLSPWAWFASRLNRLYVVDGLEPRIQVLDLATDSRKSLAWEMTSGWSAGEALRLVTDSAVSAAREGEGAGVRARIAEAPAPELPVLGGLLVDALGFIWIRPYDPLVHSPALGGLGRPGPGGTWHVLTPDGEPLPPLSVPPDLELIQVTGDRLVGIAKDDLGVESVRVHAVVRN